MKRLLICIALVGCSLAALAAVPAKTQWEYGALMSLSVGAGKTSHTMWVGKGLPKINDETVTPDALNAVGDAGWELVAVVSDAPTDTSHSVHYYFKRPK